MIFLSFIQIFKVSYWIISMFFFWVLCGGNKIAAKLKGEDAVGRCFLNLGLVRPDSTIFKRARSGPELSGPGQLGPGWLYRNAVQIRRANSNLSGPKAFVSCTGPPVQIKFAPCFCQLTRFLDHKSPSKWELFFGDGGRPGRGTTGLSPHSAKIFFC